MKFHSKAPRGLVALGSAAVIAVYSAGFVRTRAAAAKFSALPALRRPAPSPTSGETVTMTPARVGPVAEPSPAPAKREAVPSAAPKKATPEKVVTVAPAATKPQPAASATTKPEPVAAPAATDVVAPPPSTPTVPAATSSTAAAADAAAPSKTADDAPKGKYKDGTYSAWGTSRHGDLEVTVTIAEGRIESAVISKCGTRYPCSYIAHLQAQVSIRQSADVDYVSGATESANAFYYAVLDCLTRAHR